jgi:hypothetical protein
MQSLWKYLLYSEIANTLALDIDRQPLESRDEAQHALLALLDRRSLNLRDSFSDRLERKIEEFRFQEELKTSMSEDLHKGVLKELRIALLAVLQNKRRIAILVDNLDLAWDNRRDDLGALSSVIIGLLEAAQSVSDDFRRDEHRRGGLTASLAVFLRSDIFVCPATIILPHQRQLESSTTTVLLSSACVAPVERSETGATHAGEPERPAALHHCPDASDPASGGGVPFDFFACSTR